MGTQPRQMNSRRARTARLATAVAALSLSGALAARAGLIAADQPFPINEVTAGDQAVPKAAFNAAGQSMVVWDSASDGDGLGIFGRVFDAAGQPVGSEFQVNTYTAGAQFGPVVGAVAGGFVVVWESYDFVVGGDDLLFGQRFAADGAPVGSEFRVDISISEFHAQPDLASQGSDFVVVWNDYVDVFGLQLDADGNPIGSEFRVNGAAGNVSEARVAAADDGSFVVAWSDDSEIDGDGASVLARRFSAAAVPLGAELQVNSTTAGDQYAPAVAVSPAGGFMVVWETYGQTSEGDGLFAQRFSAAGGKQGTQFRVDSGDSVYAGGAALAANDEDDFVVVWNEPRSGGDGYIYSVMARRYDGTGTPSAIIDVGASGIADQSQADIAPAGADFLVVWREEIDEGDILGQRLALPSVTPGPGCDGDCNGNDVVSVAELIVAVNISLGEFELSRCTAADVNGDGVVAINELILGVNSALYGC